MLIEKTNLIQSYSKGIKSNFLKIGKILIEIRDKELWKESYNSFTQYLISADFEFQRTMSYKLMDVYKEFGENGRKRVEEKFDKKRMARDFFQLSEELIKG